MSINKETSPGVCYLFHVDHGGEIASIEVDRWGNFVQSRGPGNIINRACSWGRMMLGKWGKQIINRGLSGKTEDDDFEQYQEVK